VRFTQRRPAGTSRPSSPDSERESRLVFSLAGNGANPLPCDAVHWGRLVDFAFSHGAVVALQGACRSLPAGVVPLDVQRRLACHALGLEQRMRIVESRLEESLVALSSAGIRVVLLKGAAVAPTLYGSFVARPMNDIDILVEPSCADDARQVMLRTCWADDESIPGDAAFWAHHHLPPLVDARGSGLRLEIHTALFARGNRFRVNTRDLCADAREVAVGAGRAFVLSPRKQAVHAAVHFAWSHEMRSGAWHAFRDIATLVRHGLLSWDDLAEEAMSWRAETCVYWTLRLGRAVAELSVPDYLLDQIRPSLPEGVLRRLERHFAQWLLRCESPCPSVQLARGLWTIAMQPARSGHGKIRPWLLSSELQLALRKSTAATARWRFLENVGQAVRGSRYLLRMIR
jgi:hypothetical protein